jgi:hypothetical protein
MGVSLLLPAVGLAAYMQVTGKGIFQVIETVGTLV